MKKLLKKAISLGLSAALTVTMMVTGTVNASAAYYYNTYSTVADIATRSSCGAMQGMAVGSTWLYTVKIKGDNSQAILQKTNKNTGATTNLTDSNGSSTYSYLNHANDMDVTTIDGYSQLFVATMATGSNSLVRMKIDGSKATKEGSYTLMLNGAEKSISGVAVEKTDADNVYLLLKSGATLYRATIPKTKKCGTINITYAFKIDMSSVRVNGSNVDLSSYTFQGMGYYNGKIFVPVWGGGAGKDNQSVIAVFDTYNASGTIKSDPYLSFRITSSAYSFFEIESCDVSSDGKLYFNANRTSDKDGVFYFNDYASKPYDPEGVIDDVSGGAGSVNVRGWAFDRDCAKMSIPVHVYIGGPAGTGEGHAIVADAARTDVNDAYQCGKNHGYDAVIATSLRGNQAIYIYAINTRGGSNVLLGTRTVNISDIMPNGINLSESEITLDVGQSRVVTATVLPENANDRSVQWNSSDSSVATVDESGNITAVKVGSARITARAVNGIEASVGVTVLPDYGEVLVIYRDEDGNQLYSEKISGKIGSEYAANIRAFDGYTLKSSSNTSGVFGREQITAEFVYSLNQLSAVLKVNGSGNTVNLKKGDSITLVTTADGGTGSYTYKYVMENVTVGKTLTLKDYSSSASYTGPLTSVGTKKFTVYVKDSKGTVVATNTVTVMVTAAELPLTGSLKANGSTSQINLIVGDNVTLNTTASGGSENYTYKYVMENVTAGKTLTLKDYSSSATYTGMMTSVGTKKFTVYVKDSKGTVVETNTITVIVTKPAVTALTGSLKVNGSTAVLNMTVGSKVTLIPSASGGSGNYTYKYVMENATAGMTLTLKDYSTATSYVGPITSKGTKKFTVYVKDSKGTEVKTNTVTVVVN